MASKIKTQPDGEPITLEAAKLHLKVPHDAEDELIVMYLASARLWVEEYTHRSLLSQTWEHTLGAFPLGDIILPRGNVTVIEDIKYFDADGVQQTLQGPTSGASPVATDYQEDLSNESEARIRPPVAGSWPSAQADRLAAVTVTFVSGYGTKAEDVPESLLTGVLYRLTDLYEFRGTIDGGGTETAKLEINQYQLPIW